MAITWIVAADSARARVLQVADRKHDLVEVEDLVNPEGRMHDRELTTDANPRLHGPGGNSAREEPSAVEHAVEMFSKRISDYLEKARTQHRYDRLVLVAPPKFLGKLRKSLGREVEKLVAGELDKELYRANARELEAYFSKGSGRAP
jgi:protein required for attachment to host cells